MPFCEPVHHLGVAELNVPPDFGVRNDVQRIARCPLVDGVLLDAEQGLEVISGEHQFGRRIAQPDVVRTMHHAAVTALERTTNAGDGVTVVVLGKVLIFVRCPESLGIALGCAFGSVGKICWALDEWLDTKASHMAVQRGLTDAQLGGNLCERLCAPLGLDDVGVVVVPCDGHSSCTPLRTDSASGNALMSAVNVSCSSLMSPIA